MPDTPTPHAIGFYNDEILAVEREDGSIYVLMNRMCDNLGVQRAGQIRRIQAHSVLAKGLTVVQVQTEGGAQSLQCLRLDNLPLWLTTLQANRVREEIRPKLERYQEEAATVLWNHFRPRIEQRPAVREDASILALRQIAENARALAQLADEQADMQLRMKRTETRLDKAGQMVKAMQSEIVDMTVRLEWLEDQLQPSELITEAQAALISNLVASIAESLTRRDPSKNHYQSIFAELKRRWLVTSYHHIRQAQYKEVVEWLQNWLEAAEGRRQLSLGLPDEG